MKSPMHPQPVVVTIAQLESAINHWRERRPSVEYSMLNAMQRDALAAVLR